MCACEYTTTAHEHNNNNNRNKVTSWMKRGSLDCGHYNNTRMHCTQIRPHSSVSCNITRDAYIWTRDLESPMYIKDIIIVFPHNLLVVFSQHVFLSIVTLHRDVRVGANSDTPSRANTKRLYFFLVTCESTLTSLHTPVSPRYYLYTCIRCAYS